LNAIIRRLPGTSQYRKKSNVFEPLKVSSFSNFIKFYLRRFAQDSDSHASLSQRNLTMPNEIRTELEQEIVDALIDTKAINFEAIGNT
jgi:hypothetical protein